MEHPNFFVKNDAIYFCRAVLEHKEDYLILDTETSGIGKKDVIIQLAAIDLDGNTIVNSLVKPKFGKSISREATAIHGINSKKLQQAPMFADVFFELLPHIQNGKKFLIYNFDFDSRILEQTLEADKSGFSERLKGHCIMLEYSKFVGEWNPIHEDFKFQKLPGGDHSAIGDCFATLAVIKQMAEEEPISIPQGYKPEHIPKPKTKLVKKDDKSSEGEKTALGCIIIMILVALFFYPEVVSRGSKIRISNGFVGIVK